MPKFTVFVYCKLHFMKVAPIILPRNVKIVKDLGEQIQLARLRRKFSSEQIVERAGISLEKI